MYNTCIIPVNVLYSYAYITQYTYSTLDRLQTVQHSICTLCNLQTGQLEELVENDFEQIYRLIEELFEISFSTIRAINTTLNDELKPVVNKWIRGWILYLL